MSSNKIKVLCVDDSALIRDLMSKIIDSQPDMEVVATAPDPLVARDLIKRTNPDVLTLDVEMPRMDGLDFLERLMRLRPMPVLMVSSLTQKGSEITLRALELGAVDFVAKPEMGIREGMLEYTQMIADMIRAAARSRPKAVAKQPPAKDQAPLKAPILSSEKVIIIGASTGGYRSHPPCAGASASQLPGDSYNPAHAGRIHEILRRTSRQIMSHLGQGSSGR